MRYLRRDLEAQVAAAARSFPAVVRRIDRAPRRSGQWFLTGSQEAGLMRDVTESTAARARRRMESKRSCQPCDDFMR